MGFQHAIGGINAASKQLDVIGNNVANSGTIGFKGSRAEFADMYAANFYGVAATQTGLGVRTETIAQQFSQGNINTTGNQMDMAISGNGFFVLNDPNGISYSRNGQFKIDREGFIVNNGGSNLQGWAVDPVTGKILEGSRTDLKVDNTLLIGRPTDFPGGVNASPVKFELNIDSRSAPLNTIPTPTLSAASSTEATTSDRIRYVEVAGKYVAVQQNTTRTAPLPSVEVGQVGTVAAGVFTPILPTEFHPTSFNYLDPTSGTTQAYVPGPIVAPATLPVVPGTSVILSGVFDPSNPNTYTHTTSTKIYDSLGNPYTMNIYLVKKDMAGTSPNVTSPWDVYVNVLDPITGMPITTGLTNPQTVEFDTKGMITGASEMSFGTFTPSATPPDVAADPIQISLDLAGTTQQGASFAVNKIIQEGYGPSVVTNLEVSKEGVISARYSNGQNKAIGQVILANFPNQQGLQPIGNNRWIQTYQSGTPAYNNPGSTNTGLIQAQSLEDANIDLTAELVNMITAQRFYQANAQTIKVQDAVLQSVINLR